MAKATKKVEKSIGEMTKDELRAKANDLAEQYNDAVQNGRYTESVALDMQIKEVVMVYTTRARQECFALLKATADPMLEAVKQLRFQTIRTKDSKPEGMTIEVRTIEDAEKEIDLLQLHQFVGGAGIGKRPDWSAMIERLNFALTARASVSIGADPRLVHDSYAMSRAAHSIDIGKDPVSDENILGTVQKIVDAMIGPEYKVQPRDVNFLLQSCTRKSKERLTIQCSKHRAMRSIMAELCNRIVLSGSYANKFQMVR